MQRAPDVPGVCTHLYCVKRYSVNSAAFQYIGSKTNVVIGDWHKLSTSLKASCHHQLMMVLPTAHEAMAQLQPNSGARRCKATRVLLRTVLPRAPGSRRERGHRSLGILARRSVMFKFGPPAIPSTGVLGVYRRQGGGMGECCPYAP
jgi:hypothetical protein